MTSAPFMMDILATPRAAEGSRLTALSYANTHRRQHTTMGPLCTDVCTQPRVQSLQAVRGLLLWPHPPADRDSVANLDQLMMGEVQVLRTRHASLADQWLACICSCSTACCKLCVRARMLRHTHLPNPGLAPNLRAQRPQPRVEQCCARPQESSCPYCRVVQDALLQVPPEPLPPGPGRWCAGLGRCFIGPQQPLERDDKHNKQLACATAKEGGNRKGWAHLLSVIAIT